MARVAAGAVTGGRAAGRPSPPSWPTPHGRPVRVGGRGEVSAPPATLAIAGRPPVAITGWAGPWPVDERWWEPQRHRRLARFQVVTADGAAHLVLAEHRQWWVAASYE